MPWLLHYRVHTPDEYQEYRREYELLARSPDIGRVIEREPENPDGVARSLEVWFDDELFRTDDPALLSIHATRQQPQRPSPTEDLKRQLVDRVLSNGDGRSRLAASIALPLRRNLDYQSVARQMFAVEQLPPGALPIYDRDPDPDVPPRSLHFGERLFSSPLQIGAMAQIAQVGGGRSRIENLIGMTPASVGRMLEIRTSAHTGNNGFFQIVEFVSPSCVWIMNPNGVVDYGSFGQGHTWSEHLMPPVGEFDPATQFIDASWVTDPTDPFATVSSVIADFEAMHGRALRPSDVPPSREEDDRAGWVRVLDDSFLPDD